MFNITQSKLACIVTRTVFVGVVGLIAVGCQSYERQELDPEGHLSEWRSRNGNTEGLREFIKQSQGEAPAKDFNLSDGVSLAEAEVTALFFNPDLQVARLEAEADLATARESGRWQDPEFGISGGWMLANMDHRLMLGANFSFTIPLSGRLGVQEDLAFAGATVAFQRILVLEWEKLVQLRGVWRSAAMYQSRTDVLRAFISDIDSVAERANALRDAGELNAASARVFRIVKEETKLQIEVLSRDLELATLQAKALMGLAPNAAIKLQPEFAGNAIIPSDAEMLTRNPQIELLRRAYEVSEQKVRLEIHKQYPDLRIGPGYGYENGNSKITLGLGLPIPMWNKNVEGIARARGAREVARAKFDSAIETQFSMLAQAKHSIQTAEIQLTTLRDVIAPLVATQVQEAQELADMGEFEPMLQLNALTKLKQNKLRVIDVLRMRADSVDSITAISGPMNSAPKVSVETEES
ncbi:TolC family protein [Planctomycetota bacterium]|nr:TolC family protein [Planctomycetota bacterium]